MSHPKRQCGLSTPFSVWLEVGSSGRTRDVALLVVFGWFLLNGREDLINRNGVQCSILDRQYSG